MTPQQKFYREAYALESMSQALAILDYLQSASEQTPPGVRSALWRSFFIVYARPFTNNAQIGMVSSSVPSAGDTATHTMLVTIRNKVFGHTDPTLLTDTGGDMNTLLILKHTDGTVTPICHEPEPALSEIPRLVTHIQAVQKRFEQTAGDAFAALPDDVKNLLPGQYHFSYNAPATSQWTKVA
jgi:hypothetical protein